MIDFLLTDSGDLSLSPDRFMDEATSSEIEIQTAKCAIQSIKSDWYMDNIGANLEILIGRPFNETLVKQGESLIKQALAELDVLKNSEVYIESTAERLSVTYDIYLKTSTNVADHFVIRVGDSVELI